MSLRDGVRGDVFPAVEVGAEELYSVRRHRVGAGHGALDAVDGNAAGLQVQVGELENTDSLAFLPVVPALAERVLC